MIVKCTCTNAGQDKLHGVGNRVANKHKDKGNRMSARCTVCLKEHPVAA